MRRARFAALAAGFLCLAMVSLDALAAPPPLASSTWNWPYVRDSFASHYRYGAVNLFTRSLHGYTETVGPVTLEYSEHYRSLSSSFNNFVLTAVTFKPGQTVPIVSVTPMGEDYAINFGAAAAYRASLAGATGTKKVFLLPASGRFALMVDAAAPGEAEFHDTAINVVYRLVRTAIGTETAYLPASAQLADGSLVKFAWYTNSTHKLYVPDSFTLERNGQVIEELDVVIDTQNLPACPATSVVSSLDPARSLVLGYAASSPAGRGSLTSISVGATGLMGLVFQYQTDALGHDIIERIKDLKGNQIVEYRLETVDGYTAYTGVKTGPATAGMTAIAYDTTLATAKITAPEEPNNPVTISLDSVGRATTIADSACQKTPRVAVTYHPPGDARAGLLKDMTVWRRCDNEHAAQTIYEYNGSGTLIGTTTTALVDGVPKSASVSYTDVAPGVLTNGVKTIQVGTVTDPAGDYSTWQYYPDGRLKSVARDSGRVTVSYSYDLTPSNTVSAVYATQANGRKDKRTLDNAGRLKERVLDVTGAALTEEFGYDSQGNLETYQDTLGKVSTYNYKAPGDARVDTITVASRDGKESRSSTFSYHPLFPAAVSAADITHIKDGNSASFNISYAYLDGVPLRSAEMVSAGAKTFTLHNISYDPATLRPTRACSFSEDAALRNCVSYTYKPSSAGALAGKLDSVSPDAGTRGGGRPIVRVDYDASGDVTGKTLLETDSGKTLSSRIYTDGFGRVSKVIENEGTNFERASSYFYDPAGKPTAQDVTINGAVVSDLVYAYDNQQKSRRVTGVLDRVSGLQTSFEYQDVAARPTRRVTKYQNSRFVLADVAVTSYDPFDRALTQSSFIDRVGGPLNSGRSFYPGTGLLKDSTDQRGNITAYEEYDSFARPLTVSDPHSRATFKYELANGQGVVSVTHENKTLDAALKFPLTTRETYDVLGRVVESYNSTAKIRSTSQYGLSGTLDSVLTAYEAGSETDTASFVYDDMGRVTGALMNGTKVRGAEYGGLGSLRKEYDGHGNMTEYEYDPLGRTIQIILPDQSRYTLDSISYRAASNVLLSKTETSPFGDTVESTYGLDGQIQTHTITNPAGETKGSVFTYGPESRRLSSVVTAMVGGNDISTIIYGYDGAGRIDSITNNATEGFYSYSTVFSRVFNKFGDLISHLYPSNAGRADYSRDTYGRITDILWNNNLLARYNYDGPILTGISYGNGEITRDLDYQGSLPLLEKLTDAKRGASGYLTSLSYGYDSRLRLEAKADTGLRALNEGFGYSTLGDVNSYTASSSFAPLNFRHDYGPQPDGVLGTIGNVDSMFKIAGFGYDSRLNTTSDKAGRRAFRWGLEGIREITSSSAWAFFRQDALGRLFSYRKYSAGGSLGATVFTRDGGMVLMQKGQDLPGNY